MGFIFNGTEIEKLIFNETEIDKLIIDGTTVWESGPSIFDILIDFGYKDNGNGTYTLTSWKKTYNGTSSTELIIPDDPRIIL